MTAYYNEIDPHLCAWLRNLIAEGLIPYGHVDDRSIRDVQASDLAGFRHCHFFAGIGGFAYAQHLADWPDDLELWTGGFPCQPFSVAGRQLAQADDRHLWPELLRLVGKVRPARCLFENVAGLIPLALDGVLADLEAQGYAGRAVVVPACAVDAPHRRDRVWIIARDLADAERQPVQDEGPGSTAGAPREVQGGQEERQRLRADAGECGDVVADADGVVVCGQPSAWHEREHGADVDAVGDPSRARLEVRPIADRQRIAVRHEGTAAASASPGGAWDGAVWINCTDGAARRVEPSIRLLAHGIPGRVAALSAAGNAIVPQVAAEVLRAMRATP